MNALLPIKQFSIFEERPIVAPLRIELLVREQFSWISTESEIILPHWTFFDGCDANQEPSTT